MTGDEVEAPPRDWSQEVRYEVLMRAPDVRALVARHAAQSRETMSAEDFLKLCDKAPGPLLGGVPSDMWSFAGELLVTVERRGADSSVEAATVIKGQLYDWDKSKRALPDLFDDIKGLSA